MNTRFGSGWTDISDVPTSLEQISLIEQAIAGGGGGGPLPGDVAYTDVANTFTQTQTIDDGLGDVTTITASLITVADDSSNIAGFESSDIFVFGTDGQAQLTAGQLYMAADNFACIAEFITQDSFLHNEFVGTAGSAGPGFDITQNTVNEQYQNHGYATKIHLDQLDGSIRLQVAPIDDPPHAVNWTNALVVNHDGSVDIATGPLVVNGVPVGGCIYEPITDAGGNLLVADNGAVFMALVAA